jgi:hypothetical protein
VRDISYTLKTTVDHYFLQSCFRAPRFGLFIFPRFIDQRIINQKGLFSVQGDPTTTFVANCDKETYILLACSQNCEVTLARYLYGLGITHDFIMPGLAGFSATLLYRYHYNVGVQSKHLEAGDREED